MEGVDGGVDSFEGVCVKRAGIKGKKDSSFPALFEERAGKSIYKQSGDFALQTVSGSRLSFLEVRSALFSGFCTAV